MTAPRPRGRPPIGRAFQVRLPEQLIAALDQIAVAEGTTRAELVRRAVVEFLRRHPADT